MSGKAFGGGDGLREELMAWDNGLNFVCVIELFWHF